MTNLNAAGSIELDIAPLSTPEEKPDIEKSTEALTIEASIKPFISLIWLGVIFIVTGMAIATLRRLRESLN